VHLELPSLSETALSDTRCSRATVCRLSVTDHEQSIRGSIPDYPPDPHILDYVRILLVHKRIVSALILLTGAAFLAVTYMMPYTYEATGRLLPPDRLSSSGLLSALNASGALKILKEVENPSVDLLQNLLESRTLATMLSRDSVVRSFFKERSQTESDLVTNIAEAITVKPNFSTVNILSNVSTGWLSNVHDKECARVLPARIVNLSVKYMDSLLTGLLRADAKAHLQYALADYDSRRSELDSLDSRVQRFENEHGIVQLKSQTLSAIDELAKIETQKMQAEIDETMLSTDLTSNASARKKAALLAGASGSALQRLRFRSSVGPSFDELPEVQKSYANLILRRSVLEPIVVYLQREVEQEKVNVARNKSLITYLDPAQDPDSRISPHRVPVVFLGLTCGLVLAIMFVSAVMFRESTAIRSMRGT
jgi:LPS O-antigen subunit length determinant protein (WzzB/FepE family)